MGRPQTGRADTLYRAGVVAAALALAAALLALLPFPDPLR